MFVMKNDERMTKDLTPRSLRLKFLKKVIQFGFAKVDNVFIGFACVGVKLVDRSCFCQFYGGVRNARNDLFVSETQLTIRCIVIIGIGIVDQASP